MKKVAYEPEKCECCGQSTTYILAVDRGSVEILKQVARFIGKKGINIVHPRKEMEGVVLTSNQVGNLSRPRFHGLIAKVDGNTGNYLLTRKGSDFLRGMPIPRFAIISKAQGKQIGYFQPEENMVKITDFTNSSEFWEGINYEIKEGQVVKKANSLF